MRKFEVLLGSAVWMAISIVMVFAALEPVELHARGLRLGHAIAGGCVDGAGKLAILCETITL